MSDTAQPAATAASKPAAPAMDETQEIIDSTGRKLRLRTLDPMDTLDLLESAGTAAENGPWMRMALAVSSVDRIDGVPVPLPNSRNRIRELARKLGNAGLAAVYKHIYGAPSIQTADASEDAPVAGALTDEIAAAKN